MLEVSRLHETTRDSAVTLGGRVLGMKFSRSTPSPSPSLRDFVSRFFRIDAPFYLFVGVISDLQGKDRKPVPVRSWLFAGGAVVAAFCFFVFALAFLFLYRRRGILWFGFFAVRVLPLLLYWVVGGVGLLCG